MVIIIHNPMVLRMLIRKEKNFFAKEGAGIWVKGGEGKNIFIKDDIARDADSAGGHI